MPVIHHEVNDTGKPPRAAAQTTAEREDTEDSTTLKFDGPVQVSDDDAGSDPYNRTGKFKRLVRD